MWERRGESEIFLWSIDKDVYFPILTMRASVGDALLHLQVSTEEDLFQLLQRCVPRTAENHLFQRLAVNHQGNLIITLETFCEWMRREQGTEVGASDERDGYCHLHALVPRACTMCF